MAHHEPLKALGPIDWSDVSRDDDLSPFMTSTFSQAQTIIDSIPTPARTPPPGRARSHTNSSVLRFSDSPSPAGGREHANTTANESEAAAAAAVAHAAQLQKEWKEVKVPPKDNPMNITVYKLPAKDGRGAWFARRSVHDGLSFDKFKLGLKREFSETMKAFNGPGTGNVRGIGAERRAEHHACDGVGKTEVWLLGAQFPGPTTPRDFVTLLLTGSAEDKTTQNKNGNRPRQFMVVSRPCGHPECAPRTGYIRGSYESVEIIREIPIEMPLQRTSSSADMRQEDSQLPAQQSRGDGLGKEAVLPSAAREAAFESAGDPLNVASSTSELPSHGAGDDSEADPGTTTTRMVVEWIMVTRSDPGGSVPRFMVEKGTPGGIVNDAGRFIKWLETKSAKDFEDSGDNDIKEQAIKSEASAPPLPMHKAISDQRDTDQYLAADEEPPSGLYNMITGALGAVASRLPNFANATDPYAALDSDTDNSDSDESDQSYASAPEPDPATPSDDKAALGGDLASLKSGKSEESGNASTTQHEKQLKKLQERHRKLEEKRAKQQERSLQGKQGQSDDALAKLKEKHEKEIARQDENFRKEVKKLEGKRIKDEKKAEERRKKEAEKEAKNNIALDLDRTRIERDIALKQVDILKEQVGKLQAQNTKLVAEIGRLGALGKSDEQLGNGNGSARVDDGKASPRSSQSK